MGEMTELDESKSTPKITLPDEGTNEKMEDIVLDDKKDEEDNENIDERSSRGSISTISNDLPPMPYYPPSLPPPPSPSKPLPPPSLFSRNSQRLRISLMLMLCLYVVVSMRLNLSMAVVCMVNSTAYSTSSYHSDLSTTTLSSILPLEEQSKCSRRTDIMANNGYNGTLLWSPHMQSILFSATFYGSLATITISGTIADRFGPKICLGGAVIVYIVVTFLSPLLSQYSFLAYFISRLIMGLAEGFIFPSIGSMSGRWFPQSERSTMAAIYTSGNQLAASLTSIISSTLCSSILGWPSIFYLFGGLGVIWLIGWCIIATNVPDENPFISVREALYLREVIQRKKKVTRVPWRSMIKSKAVYACLSAQFSYNFTATIMQGFLPTYFRDELLLPLGQNGLYTMIPFISQLITKNMLSLFADWLRRKKILKPTKCTKMFQSISSIGSALSMIGLALLPSCEKPWIAAVFLALYGAFFSAGIPGFFTSLLSIAPQYSGTMISLGMTSGSIANILGPLWLSVVMLMKTPYTWPIVFLTGGAINIIAGTIFFFFGDGEVQDWAKIAEPSEPTHTSIHSIDRAMQNIKGNEKNERPKFTLDA